MVCKLLYSFIFVYRSVSTILMGLISFMNESTPTLGSITTSDAEKRILARKSRDFNLKNSQFWYVVLVKGEII